MFRFTLVLLIACLINIPSVLSAVMLKKDKYFNITLANNNYELRTFSVSINNEVDQNGMKCGSSLTADTMFYPIYFADGMRSFQLFKNMFYREMLDMAKIKGLYFVVFPEDYNNTYAVTEINSKTIYMNMFANHILVQDKHTWQTVYQCTTPIIWYFLHEVFHIAYIYNKEELIALCQRYGVRVDWGAGNQESIAHSFTEKNQDQFYADMEHQYRIRAAVENMDYENDMLEDQPYKPLR